MTRIVLELHVQPGAKRTGFAGMHGERLKLHLAAPAREGRANEAMISFLADYYRVPRKNVSITGGLRSRAKRVVIEPA